MCISPEQQRKKDEARKEAEDSTYGVCATGEKYALNEYDESSNQINNE